jgi:hypothetical protein
MRRTFALALALIIVPLAARAGEHREFGKWVVTSDEREKEFYACIENRPEMSEGTKACLNDKYFYATNLDECDDALNEYFDNANPCLAKQRPPKVDFHPKLK